MTKFWATLLVLLSLFVAPVMAGENSGDLHMYLPHDGERPKIIHLVHTPCGPANFPAAKSGWMSGFIYSRYSFRQAFWLEQTGSLCWASRGPYVVVRYPGKTNLVVYLRSRFSQIPRD